MLKELEEKRATLQEEMDQLLAKAKEEKRAMTDEEIAKFDELEKSIKSIDATMDAEKRALDLVATHEVKEEGKGETPEERSEESEVRAFEAFLRGEETRAEFTKSDNGAVIPTSIANKIIDKVVEICPIYKDADRYNIKGTLQIPYYDASTEDVTVSWVSTEGTAVNPKAGTFSNIELKGFLASAISDISKTLINNSQFDIVSFVINKMAEKFARFIEGELLQPSDAANKVAGLSGAAAVETAAAGAVTLDDIINLQETVPDVYQAKAYFVMSKAQRTALRQIKDNEGRYVLNPDATSRWGYTLLGKDVYISDNMPTIGSSSSGDLGMYYGDMSGLAVKVSEEVNIEVLREVKAAQHMVEIVGFVEFDSKVENAQKVAKLVSK